MFNRNVVPDDISTRNGGINRRLWLAIGHIGIILVVLFAFFPKVPPVEEMHVSSGRLSSVDICNSRSCRKGIAIEDLKFSCGTSAFGPHLICPQVKQGDQGDILWFAHQTLTGQDNVVVRLNVNGNVVWHKSKSEIQRHAVVNSLFLLLPVMMISFYAFSQIRYFKDDVLQ